MNEPRGERSIGELFSELTGNLTLLVKQEIALAKSELSQKFDKITGAAVSLGIGAVLAHTGLLALVAALILGLSMLMRPWIAALVVGLLFVIVGGILLMSGINRLKELDLTPHRTVESLQDDVALVKEKTR